MGHNFSFCQTCETPLDCDCCDKLDTLKEEAHGSWEMVSRWWVCSECGNAVPGAVTTLTTKLPFCPYCGARMEEGKHDHQGSGTQKL